MLRSRVCGNSKESTNVFARPVDPVAARGYDYRLAMMNEAIYSKPLRLARLDARDVVRAGLIGTMVALAFALFHFQGNTTDIRWFGRSALIWMVDRWGDSTLGSGDYSHGWLIPLVSLWVVWSKRRELATAPKAQSRMGLAVVVAALLLHWLGAKAQQTRMSLMGLVLLIWGVPFHVYGWQVAKILIFPCAYLIFCIPLNFLDSLTFPLRMFATASAAVILNGLGIAVERSGSIIQSIPPGAYTFGVEEACSGIRSLLALTAIAAAYAYMSQKTLAKKWILFLSSIPIAIIVNTLRVTSVVVIAEFFGSKFAGGTYHDASGYAFFLAVSMALLMLVDSLLKRNYSEIRTRWKHALFVPTPTSSP